MYVHSLWYWLNSGNEGSLSSALLNSMLSFYEGSSSISTHIVAHPDQFPSSPWKIWLSWLASIVTFSFHDWGNRMYNLRLAIAKANLLFLHNIHVYVCMSQSISTIVRAKCVWSHTSTRDTKIPRMMHAGVNFKTYIF